MLGKETFLSGSASQNAKTVEPNTGSWSFATFIDSTCRLLVVLHIGFELKIESNSLYFFKSSYTIMSCVNFFSVLWSRYLDQIEIFLEFLLVLVS